MTRTSRTRTTAVALTIGGLLWAAAALVGGADGGDRFVLAESVWLIAQLLLLVGTIWFWRLGLHHGRRLGTAGFTVQAIGRVAFVAAEALALARGEVQDDLFPLAAIGVDGPPAAALVGWGIAFAAMGIFLPRAATTGSPVPASPPHPTTTTAKGAHR